MYSTYIRFLFFSMMVLVAVSPSVAQTGQETDVIDSSFVFAPSVLPAELTGAQSESAYPPPPESPSTEFRATVQDFKKHKHQYVHCKLKTGKILTGQIKDAGYEAFTIKTEALGGMHSIKYDDLAEVPRAVPAVGTRFKQGAQWTGLVTLIVVGLPILILVSPLLFLSGLQC